MSKTDKELKKIQNNVKKATESMSDTLSKLQDSMKPLADLSDLESKINSLTKMKDIIVNNETNDESDAPNIFETMDTILDIVNNTPNDKELGKTIRQFMRELTEDKPKDQLDLFE